jgi:uncharacterized protein (TIGR00369 family)
MNDKHKQQHGFIHGRVISYLADNCLTFAGGSMLGDSVTLEFKINYIKPGLGNTLTARASVLSSGRKNAVCECRIYAGYEALIAVTQGTIVKV